MALFYFKGRNALDRIVKGKVVANSSLEVGSYLKRENISLIELRKVSPLRHFLDQLYRLILILIPIRRSTVSTFYYQMAGMLSVDIPIKSAINIVASHMMNQRMASVLIKIEQQLVKGVPLASALAKFKRIFGNAVIQLISLAGSRTELIAVFRYCDMALNRSALFQRAMILILPNLSFFIAFILLFVFLEHRYLSDFYFSLSAFNKAVPDSIVYFEQFVGLVTSKSLLIVPVAIVVLLFSRFLLCLFSLSRLIYHSILFFLPVIGHYLCALERERLSLIIFQMLEGGATVQRCLEYGVKVVGNDFFRRKLMRSLKMLNQGESFSDAIVKHGVFSPAETQMLVLGEAAGNLCDTFARVHKICQLLIERRIEILMEALRLLMLLLNLTALVSLVVVTEVIFFYPSA